MHVAAHAVQPGASAVSGQAHSYGVLSAPYFSTTRRSITLHIHDSFCSPKNKCRSTSYGSTIFPCQRARDWLAAKG